MFSHLQVNASGQFCGVAEMVGRVDFQRDMDFWQQDKWSGSFPIKWHMIKDVPNSTFRHITLPNNENKPVTNSRDTQEVLFVVKSQLLCKIVQNFVRLVHTNVLYIQQISFEQGEGMLKIFKNHKMKSSIFDDFMYYENRQQVIHEGRIRLLSKMTRPSTSLFMPATDTSRKLNGEVAYSPTLSEKTVSVNHTSKTAHQNLSEKDKFTSLSSPAEEKHIAVSTEPKKKTEVDVNSGILSTLMIGSLTIDSKVAELLKPTKGPPAIVHPKPVETVTIGSLPVKVNGLSGPLTFGSLPPDIKVLKRKNKHY